MKLIKALAYAIYVVLSQPDIPAEYGVQFRR